MLGGKGFREEAERVVRMNMLVGTPGRLLQHLEETPGFDASNVQVALFFIRLHTRTSVF